MDILNWPIAKRQGDDCLRLSRELPPMSVHDRGVYQKHSLRKVNDEWFAGFPRVFIGASRSKVPRAAGLTLTLVAHTDVNLES
jgi:hypothetical protein